MGEEIVFSSWIECFYVIDGNLNDQDRKGCVSVRETVALFFSSKKFIFKAQDVIVDMLMHVLDTDIIVVIHH